MSQRRRKDGDRVDWDIAPARTEPVLRLAAGSTQVAAPAYAPADARHRDCEACAAGVQRSAAVL